MLVSARVVTLRLAETFVISRSAQETAEVVHVELEHDGTSATIRAWRVRPELYSPLRQYEVVTGTLTRNLRYVRAISETESELTAAKVATAPRA